jgi:signal transduction histidine kinase
MNKTRIQLGNGADIAFLLVVLAAYFAIFSAAQNLSITKLISMILLGIAYLMVGIYGYRYILESDALVMRAGYFFVQLILSGSILMIGSSTMSNLSLNALLLLPLVVQSVVLLPRIGLVLVNSIILGEIVLVLLKQPNGLNMLFNSLPLFFVAQIFIVFFTQMAVNEEHSRVEINRLIAELEDANAHLRNYALQVEELAITQERNRMAREIHDGLGHYLTSIYMQVQAARMVLLKKPEKAEDALQKAQNLAQDALKDVRHSVSTLRSPILENIPLSAAIQRLLDHTEFGEMTVIFELVGEEKQLSPQTNWTLYRAVQEGINNSNKYSKASKLTITLDFTEMSWITLCIDDDGQGASNPGDGFGLIGLGERVNLLKGHCEIRTEPGNGFHICIGVPG